MEAYTVISETVTNKNDTEARVHENFSGYWKKEKRL
jgi:hypothetical protein